MIVVVDYHKGNIMSVERGLVAAGAEVVVSDDPAVIAQADAIVLPGVGAFADAVATMEELGQMEVIRRRVQEDVTFLGICLGMHLMFEEGEENAPEVAEGEDPRRPRGLSILPGVVDRLPSVDESGTAYKIPHVGWNSIEFDVDSPLFAGIEPGEFFYFTHSYAAPEGPGTIATTVHATAFPSIVQYRDRAFGVQFHPEKSSDAGMRMLRNFVNIAKEG